MRALDVVRGIEVLAARREVDPARITATGRASAALPVLYAALFDPRISSVATEGMLSSYDSVVSGRLSMGMFEQLVPSVLQHFDLGIPAGSSLAIVGQNGAGKTTLAKLLCRLYDPQSGAIEIDGVPLRDLSLESWRTRVTAVFQDFIRFELPLRDNVAPSGAPDEDVRAALESAGATQLASLDTILAKGYEGGTDLSGGQWQRVALARALCAVRADGAARRAR